MEEIPQRKNESVEVLADWKLLRTEGPEKAESLMNSIPGFGDMTPDSRIEALDQLMTELSKDNENRYVVRELGRYFEKYTAERALKEKLVQLGFAA